MTATIKLALAVAALVIALLVFGPAACNMIRGQKAQNRMDTSQSEAFRNSVEDAIATHGEVNANQIASEETTRQNSKEIRDAEGSHDAVRAPVRDAGFASLCKRPSFRNAPANKLRCNPPGRVD